MGTLQTGYGDMRRVRLRRNLRARVQQWWPDVELQDIHSGAVIQDPNAPGCYLIDTNTVEGLRQLRHAKRVAVNDPQSEEGDFAIRGSGYVVVFEMKTWSSAFGSLRSLFRRGKVRRKSAETKTETREGSFAATALLSKMAPQNTSREERRRAVIEAEVVSFPPGQVGTLNHLLRQFIEQYRNSDDQQDLVAVGSAIRKYVTTMSRDGLSALAILLDAEHNATVPIEVELEVAKTLVRTLVQKPPEESDSEPELADRLHEIVNAYLNPRLLSRDKVGAVTLNAILALCLLRTRHTGALQKSLADFRASWFTELVLRRASHIRNSLLQTFPKERAERYAEHLVALNRESASNEA